SLHAADSAPYFLRRGCPRHGRHPQRRDSVAGEGSGPSLVDVFLKGCIRGLPDRPQFFMLPEVCLDRSKESLWLKLRSSKCPRFSHVLPTRCTYRASTGSTRGCPNIRMISPNRRFRCPFSGQGSTLTPLPLPRLSTAANAR